MWGSLVPAWSPLATTSSTTSAWSVGWMSRWSAQHAGGPCPHPNTGTTPFCPPPSPPLGPPSCLPFQGLCYLNPHISIGRNDSGTSAEIVSTQQAVGGYILWLNGTHESVCTMRSWLLWMQAWCTVSSVSATLHSPGTLGLNTEAM